MGMGCDIHAHGEVRQKDGTWKNVGKVFPVKDKIWADIIKSGTEEPFYPRNYGVFGFLADVRNYSHVPTIAPPKYAIPEDASPETIKDYEGWEDDAHTATWLTLAQLLEPDYDKTFWDRRVTKQTAKNVWDGAALAEEGEGTHPTLREFLGDTFFSHLEFMKGLGAPDDVRVVFWFDN
jgi:hypothetical protein